MSDSQPFRRIGLSNPAGFSDPIVQPETVIPKAPVVQSTNSKIDQSLLLPVVDTVPLLKELGIDFGMLFHRLKLTLAPTSNPSFDVIKGFDFFGPVLFFVFLGFIQTMRSKLHFGYLYVLLLLASFAFTFLLSCLSLGKSSCTVYLSVSILGYSTFPMIIFALVQLIVGNIFPVVQFVLFVLWSTKSASGCFSVIANIQESAILIGYPCFLYFSTIATLLLF
ncbi:hypothetical protein PCE1_003307 [Barthelona sp. PCE]